MNYLIPGKLYRLKNIYLPVLQTTEHFLLGHSLDDYELFWWNCLDGDELEDFSAIKDEIVLFVKEEDDDFFFLRNNGKVAGVGNVSGRFTKNISYFFEKL